MSTRIRHLVSACMLLWAAAAHAAPADTDRQRLQAENAQLRRGLATLKAQVEALSAEVKALKTKLAARGGSVSGTAAPARRKLDIRVMKDNWGNAGPNDIQKVLLSAAGELWKHTGQREKLKPVVIRRSTSGPISLYRKGEAGEYVVKLDVAGTYWCQFAYQFAHEFCHILTNYDRRRATRYQWFDESLCELASLYSLPRMAESWKTSPPYPNWRGYSSALAKYAKDTRTKKDGQLPAGQTFGAWFAKNRTRLRKEPCNRGLNRVVAYRLLDLFETEPAGWAAVGYLNLTDPAGIATFEDHLRTWQAACPPPLKGFVAKVMARFDVKPK